MFFDGNSKRRRYVALVTLWNSNDSWFAFKELLSYTYRCVPGDGESWDDFVYGLTFCIIALAVFGGSIAMGIVGPSLVQIGNVAPVRPSTLFYPDTPAGDDAIQTLQDFGLRAPGVMRALGSVEAARVTLRKRVSVDEDTNHESWGDGDRVISLTYSYSLSGVDLGLQGETDLALAVEGSCLTEYGWYNEIAEEDPTDNYNSTLADGYNLWNNASEQAWVYLNDFDIQHAPMASFKLHPQGYEQLLGGSRVSYAVIVHSARRSSISPGSDPWYATEPRNTPDRRFNAGYRMKRQRPILSCWQQDKWRYGTENVDSVFNLRDIPGIQIPTVLLEVLETAFGTSPMIVRLGNASGDSALRSRTTSPNGVIDAGASSIYDDMERLILASFVASRNVFSDATMFREEENYPNIFRSSTAEPEDGAGNFVVSSPDIQTFSLTGIVTVTVIFVALILINSVVWLLVRFHHGRQGSGPASLVTNDKWTRFHVLTAVQLFRCMYEPGANTESSQWSCGTSVPPGTGKSVELARNTAHTHCKGHINKETHCPPKTPDVDLRSNGGEEPNAGTEGAVRPATGNAAPNL
ncbi:hypothetical protein DL769_005744 [Monosporascus sp. CRB-8-3]|nr:hypothetical protein DL769_005744 [Monosporascus sp. CRB-8-3]